jgi:hypothetical protein
VSQPWKGSNVRGGWHHLWFNHSLVNRAFQPFTINCLTGVSEEQSSIQFSLKCVPFWFQ